MSQAIENKESPAMKTRLRALGFEQVQFEPKVNNRFIVYMDGFPSYVVKGVNLPAYDSLGDGWNSYLELECYNPLGVKLEQAALDLIKKGDVQITVKILSPTATVDTTWEITAQDGSVGFGPFNWSDEGEPNLLFLTFRVKNVKISYPTE